MPTGSLPAHTLPLLVIERGAFFEGMGAQSSEVAKALDIGAETVRSHLKKAQTKLGARNRTQAVAEALRQKLIH